MNDLTIAVRQYAKKVSGLEPLTFNLRDMVINKNNPVQFKHYDRMYQTSAFCMLDVLDILKNASPDDKPIVRKIYVKEIAEFTNK